MSDKYDIETETSEQAEQIARDRFGFDYFIDSERGNNAKSKKRKRNNNRHIEYNMYYIKVSTVRRSGNNPYR